MNLTLYRKWFTDISTTGVLFIDDAFFCYTLEDAVREQKVYGKTAIPYGKYEVVITYSPRFQKNMPLLLNVPNYEGVRIHTGNTARDTEGCILVGKSKGYDFIGGSRNAFNELMERIKGQKLTLEIMCDKLASLPEGDWRGVWYMKEVCNVRNPIFGILKIDKTKKKRFRSKITFWNSTPPIDTHLF